MQRLVRGETHPIKAFEAICLNGLAQDICHSCVSQLCTIGALRLKHSTEKFRSWKLGNMNRLSKQYEHEKVERIQVDTRLEASHANHDCALHCILMVDDSE